jgi:hypothetical protein
MKIKIQNTNDAFRVQERWNLMDYLKSGIKTVKENGAAIIAAQFFLEAFPRFKEIIINTELTEDVQADNKDRERNKR